MAAKLKNLPRLARKLRRIPKEARREMHAAMKESAEEITILQRRLVPRDSGDLEASISYTFGKFHHKGKAIGVGDPDLSLTIHAGDEKAFYAGWIEFGVAGPWTMGGRYEGATHPGFAAQPFFFAAYRSLKRRTTSRLKQAAKQGIKKIARNG